VCRPDSCCQHTVCPLCRCCLLVPHHSWQASNPWLERQQLHPPTAAAAAAARPPCCCRTAARLAVPTTRSAPGALAEPASPLVRCLVHCDHCALTPAACRSSGVACCVQNPQPGQLLLSPTHSFCLWPTKLQLSSKRWSRGVHLAWMTHRLHQQLAQG
jgi:hypothetical protein